MEIEIKIDSATKFFQYFNFALAQLNECEIFCQKFTKIMLLRFDRVFQRGYTFSVVRKLRKVFPSNYYVILPAI